MAACYGRVLAKTRRAQGRTLHMEQYGEVDDSRCLLETTNLATAALGLR